MDTLLSPWENDVLFFANLMLIQLAARDSIDNQQELVSQSAFVSMGAWHATSKPPLLP